jgi:hypothetical protein
VILGAGNFRDCGAYNSDDVLDGIYHGQDFVFGGYRGFSLFMVWLPRFWGCIL